MKIQFTKFDSPKPLDWNVLNQLKEVGDDFFVLLEENKQVIDKHSRFYRYKSVPHRVVRMLRIHANITVLGHDIFLVKDDIKIIGYSKIEFDINEIDEIRI